MTLEPSTDAVERRHPYHDWSHKHTAAAAGDVAELLRYLNHAAMHEQAVPSPAAAAAVLVELAAALDRMPTLTARLGRRVSTFDPAPLRLIDQGHASDLFRRELNEVAAALTGGFDQLVVIGEEMAQLGHRVARLYLPAKVE